MRCRRQAHQSTKLLCNINVGRYCTQQFRYVMAAKFDCRRSHASRRRSHYSYWENQATLSGIMGELYRIDIEQPYIKRSLNWLGHKLTMLMWLALAFDQGANIIHSQPSLSSISLYTILLVWFLVSCYPKRMWTLPQFLALDTAT